MILIFKIFLIFVLLPLGVVGVVSRIKRVRDNYDNKLLLVLVFGLTPLLIALEMVYLIKFLPEKNDWVYVIILILSWGLGFTGLSRGWTILKMELKNIGNWIIKLNLWNKLLLTIALIPMIIFSLQELAYPVVDYDSGKYIGQSEALYKYRNLDWGKVEVVTIRDGDNYTYDSSIREGTPALMVVSFLGENQRYGYFFYSFIAFYYYLLLVVSLLLIEKDIVITEKNKNIRTKAYLFVLLFTAYSWMISRSLVFSTKEMVIYFLAVMALLVLKKMVLSNRLKYVNILILGIIGGLNMLVNLHGIIIFILILVLYFIFKREKILIMLISLSLLVIVAQLFCNFEFSRMIGFLLVGNFGYYENLTSSWWKSLFVHNRGAVGVIKMSSTTSVSTSASTIDVVDRIDQALNSPAMIDRTHMAVYQIKTVKDLYIKAKLQLFTNVGTYGFYIWFALLSTVLFWKKIIGNKMSQIVLIFFILYFLLVLDPLSLNHHPFAAVLYGSMKYSGLLMTLGILLAAAHFDEILKLLFMIVDRYRLYLIILLGSVVLIILLKEDLITDILTGFLLSIIQQYKDRSFYFGKMSEYLHSTIGFIAFIFLSGLISRKWGALSCRILEVAVLAYIVVLPLFITDVGKVSFGDTLKYLFSDRENKMTNTIFFGDQYKVYFDAKRMLPQGTLINNEFSGVLANDDYFKIVYKSKGTAYKIRRACVGDEKLLIDYPGAKLCYSDQALF